MVGSREDCLGKEVISVRTYLAPLPPNNQERLVKETTFGLPRHDRSMRWRCRLGFMGVRDSCRQVYVGCDKLASKIVAPPVARRRAPAHQNTDDAT